MITTFYGDQRRQELYHNTEDTVPGAWLHGELPNVLELYENDADVGDRAFSTRVSEQICIAGGSFKPRWKEEIMVRVGQQMKT